MNLGLSKVLSIFGTIIPTNYINNLVENGLANLYPLNTDNTVAPIKSVIWQRAGERFPFLYNIDTKQKDDTDSDFSDPQIVRNFQSAIKVFSEMDRTNVNPENNRVEDNTASEGLSYKLYNDGGSTAGIGVSYDHISNDGVSFKNIPLGIQLNLGLNSNNPHGLYLFVHNKNTIIIENGNVQVIS